MGPPGFRPTEVIFDPEWDTAYVGLEEAAKAGKKPQQGQWKRFQAALHRIRNDGQWGEVIRKKDIPDYFVKRYGVTNLYCIDLSGECRCFYWIDGQDIVFLDLMDHAENDRLFGLS